MSGDKQTGQAVTATDWRQQLGCKSDSAESQATWPTAFHAPQKITNMDEHCYRSHPQNEPHMENHACAVNKNQQLTHSWMVASADGNKDPSQNFLRLSWTCSYDPEPFSSP